MKYNRLIRYSRAILYPLMVLLYRVRVYGDKNIPKTGAAIIAINHASYMDSLLVGYFVTNVRPFRALGKKELLDTPILGAFLRGVGTIPVDRDRGDLGAMRQALKVLKNQEALLLAPEGTRGGMGRSQTPKPGVSFIAHHSRAAVIPARLYGTPFPQIPGRMWIKFGEPIHFDVRDIEKKGRDRAYMDFVEDLLKGIYAMKEGE